MLSPALARFLGEPRSLRPFGPERVIGRRLRDPTQLRLHAKPCCELQPLIARVLTSRHEFSRHAECLNDRGDVGVRDNSFRLRENMSAKLTRPEENREHQYKFRLVNERRRESVMTYRGSEALHGIDVTRGQDGL